MKHQISGKEYYFEGIITNVTIQGNSGINENIIIIGKSPTIKLDGKKAMDSFMNTNLAGVVKQAVSNTGNGAEVQINPKCDDTLDYICQYNESDFEFLNRLSYIFGEPFFYDGENIKFGWGRRDPNMIDLTYDKNMFDYHLSANLVPARFNRYNYFPHNDTEQIVNARPNVDHGNSYLQDALNKSDKAFAAEGDLPMDAPVTTLTGMENLVKIERSRAAGEMLVINGSSTCCAVALAKTINVMMPETLQVENPQVGSFIITDIVHHISNRHYYTNEFTGVVSSLGTIPMTPIDSPRTGVQQATVIDNSDSKGRVKVQLQWQKNLGKSTNWIRVQTPDAGSSDKVSSNRGFVSIPEVGDTVVVGFEYGDPNRPFVMGSLFSEFTGAGGGANNDSKSFSDKTGSALQLAAGAVTLHDKKPKHDFIKFDGNGNLTIKADNSGLLEICGNDSGSFVSMKNFGIIVLGGSQSITLKPNGQNNGQDGDTYIKLESNGTITIKGTKIKIEGSESTSVNAPTNTITGKTTIQETEGSTNKIDVSGGNVIIH